MKEPDLPSCSSACRYKECGRPIDGSSGFGFCQAHYRRFKNGKDMDPPIRESGRGSLESRIMRWVPAVFGDDCYVWPKTLSHGYAVIGGEGGSRAPKVMVGRWLYERLIGPTDGMNMMHICDNPPCVNPNHLRPGSQRENIHDMIAKGRQFRKLTDKDVVAIRADSRTHKAIAADYGVSKSAITAVKMRRGWKHL